MGGICGWVGAGHRSWDLSRMAQRLRRDSIADTELISAQGCAVALASQSPARILWQDNEFCLVIDGYPRWHDKPIWQEDANDLAHRLLAGYKQHGGGVLANLHGQFALVLTRKDGKEALLATDRLGSQPLKYSEVNNALLFASYADAIHAMTPGQRQLDDQALFNYLYFDMIPGPGTAFRNIYRLLPGQCVQFKDDRIFIDAYWRPDYLHHDRRPQRDLELDLMRLLQDSVKASIGPGKTGAFLSGGVDSSTVTGMLSRVTDAPARTYSIGFDAPGYDEMEFARIAARHFGSEHHEYYVTPPDVASAAPQIATAYDAPFGNASAVPSLYCARLAKADGIDHLLGGDGGDELFGGNSRYAKQWIFSLYENIPGMIRRGLVEPALSSSLGQLFFLRKVRSYVRQAATPMPERTESYNLLSRLGPQRIFCEEFLSSINPAQPLQMISESYHQARADNLLERMLAVDLRFTLADNDLPKVSGMCALCGIGVSFPFLDDRIVSFAQRLPADLKVRRTYLRFFFKRAVKGFLPDEIIAKKKHGFGLPFGLWLKTDPGLQSLVRDALGDLKQRRIIREKFIEELLSDRLQEHAAYFGTMAWSLMMLELWLQSQGR